VVFGRLKFIFFSLIGTIILGTLIFQFYYSPSFDTQFSGNILDSVLATISLMFAMEIYGFPHDGNLIIKLIYIIYPFLGLLIIGLGIIEFGMVTFTLRYRLHAWNEWMARRMENHTILCGLGNIGTRILHELVNDKIPAVIITLEKDHNSEVVQDFIEDSRVSILFGDATQKVILRQANVKKARAIIAVTNDDLVNFKIASRAKELNPKIRTVIRAFDRSFSSKVTQLFDIDAAISTSAIAAPAFVATSFEDGIIQTLKSKKGNTEFHLMELNLRKDFHPTTVGSLEESYNITILAVDREAHPDAQDHIKTGAKLLVLGEITALRQLKAQFC